MKSNAIIDAVEGVTKKWAKQRKAEERHSAAQHNRRARLTVSYRTTIKDAAWECMEEAYLKASTDGDGGALPALARQIMYQARPIIQAETGEQLNDQYFCQTLLPDFLTEFPKLTKNWDVVFDVRGNFEEPHTDRVVGLGTLPVRRYLADVHAPSFVDVEVSRGEVRTLGPKGQFGAVLFIEKEGYMPLFKKVRLAERYDIAIMSTKGVSSTAARKLIDDVCGENNIPLLVLHDFDKAGFSILGTLKRNTRRYTFRNRIKVIDLGLRLKDVEELGLESETAYDRGSRWAIRNNLRLNGATAEEIEFLLNRRVEFNALPSRDLVNWIETKLEEAGIVKVIPDDALLDAAYRHSFVSARLWWRLQKLMEDDAEEVEDSADVPDDLRDEVMRRLSEHPEQSWIEALDEIANDAADQAEA